MHHLEFFSDAEKDVEAGLQMCWPKDLQPFHPWSLAWRSDDVVPSTRRLIDVATGLSEELDWLSVTAGGHDTAAWMPDDEPAWRELREPAPLTDSTPSRPIHPLSTGVQDHAGRVGGRQSRSVRRRDVELPERHPSEWKPRMAHVRPGTTGRKSTFSRTPQSGQHQSSGTWAQAVPGASPSLGWPALSS